MSGRQSAATDKALELVAQGMTPYRAAKTVGIAFSTCYNAIKRQKQANKVPDALAKIAALPHSQIDDP